MSKQARAPKDVIEAIQAAARALGRTPSRSQFFAHSGMGDRQILNHFTGWNEAVIAAGLVPYTTNQKIDDEDLLKDWGLVVRKNRQIPTREQYRRQGEYSPGVIEKRFGAWLMLPGRFREFAGDKAEWADVAALLPAPTTAPSIERADDIAVDEERHVPRSAMHARHSKLADRPTYGNPIDFRGLRHEPVNENGVVFLFGMVARELGYMVEAVQFSYPDCEAKRQVGPNIWQRVRIEFEFESRNFRDHGHAVDGCDVIVCWHHNWTECPGNIEVVELASEIKRLSKSED